MVATLQDIRECNSKHNLNIKSILDQQTSYTLIIWFETIPYKMLGVV